MPPPAFSGDIVSIFCSIALRPRHHSSQLKVNTVVDDDSSFSATRFSTTSYQTLR